MRRILLVLETVFVVLLAVSCALQTPQQRIRAELGLDVSGASELSRLETHGGFHNDGTTFYAWACADEGVREAIQNDEAWQALPPDETVRTLLWGGTREVDGEVFEEGPFLTDDAGNPLVPEIGNGYYRLIDRHDDKDNEPDLLRRGSFNFTLGVYDADENVLYYCKLDT